jgi:hypothetical protein
MSLERKVTRLEAENESLRDRVTILEELLYGDMDEPLPSEWGLTRCEEKMFRAMLGRTIAPREYLCAASCLDYASDEPNDPKIVRVRVSKMRPKLTPFGIEIRTHWGRGYSLDDATRETFKAILRRAA